MSERFSQKTAAPGNWDSPITAEGLFSNSQAVSQPRPWRGGVLFLLTMPEEGNAHALMYSLGPGRDVRISPPGYNIRSRVHEYGGAAFAASENAVYYVNFQDQAIYRQEVDFESGVFGLPALLTVPEPSQPAALRYLDLLVDASRHRLVAVREDHRALTVSRAGGAVNSLISIPLDAVDPVTAEECGVLFSDSDFVSSPALSPQGDRLAVVAWSHPNMPWDQTRLLTLCLDDNGNVADRLEVDVGDKSAKLQPEFGPDGSLFLLTDRSGYWNLAVVDARQLDQAEQSNGGLSSRDLFPIDAECASAPWQTGNSHYCVVDERTVVVTVCRNCAWELLEVDLRGESPRAQSLEKGHGQLDQVRLWRQADDLNAVRSLAYLAADARRLPHIRRRLLDKPKAGPDEAIYVPPGSEALPEDYLSQPEHISYPTANNETAHGLFYHPLNPRFQLQADQLPPLLVSVHGGPTSTARIVLNPSHQFWTSRGFAVLDVNHRGSTGYGRRFRRLLYQQWGVAEVEDVIHAVDYLVKNRRVAADKVAIRGGSAGGYVVLACLAQSSLFAAGVSYYGVSDLETLASGTHKFESRYLDQLVGPYPQTRRRYRDRSPIHQVDAIRVPVLLLQGVDDAVVPPEQSERLFDRLRKTSSDSAYLRFEGEAHGFRRPENQIRALTAELDFYRRNLLKSND